MSPDCVGVSLWGRRSRSLPNVGFPKIMGPYLGVSISRTVVCWGLPWAPLFMEIPKSTNPLTPFQLDLRGGP